MMVAIISRHLELIWNVLVFCLIVVVETWCLAKGLLGREGLFDDGKLSARVLTRVVALVRFFPASTKHKKDRTSGTFHSDSASWFVCDFDCGNLTKRVRNLEK